MNKYKNKQKGMTVGIIIGSMAVLGILGYIGSTVISAILSGNQKSNLTIQSSQGLTQASYILTTETTKNGSGIPVAPAIAAGTVIPIGGGTIPNSSAAPKIDAFGTNFGYCTNNATTQSDPVFAVISAGSNKTFDTTCTQALAGTAISDDKVIVKSVANILQGVGGTVYFGDPVATVADLGNLLAASIKPGQMRVVLADISVWVNKTGIAGAGNWTQVAIGGVVDTTPSKQIAAYYSATCPSGWLVADGTNGTPDLRGEFIRGLDNGRGVDSGRTLASSQVGTSFPSFYVYSSSATSGQIVSHPISSNSGYPNDMIAKNADTYVYGASSSYMTAPLTPGGSSGLVSFTARPRNIALLYCMKQ